MNVYRLVIVAALVATFVAGAYAGMASHVLEAHGGRVPTELADPEVLAWSLGTAVVAGALIGWLFGWRVGAHATRLRIGGEVADVLVAERARRKGKAPKRRLRLN